MPKIDRRDKQDVLEEVKALASSYVPEWSWDDKNPDAGVVLAHVFSAMMEGTISRYNRTPYNHYLSFLNMTGTRLLPPVPAEGMVSVGVMPGYNGAYIDKGTAVYAAADNDNGRVFFQTTEAMQALDTQVEKVFFTSAQKDSIVCAYDRVGLLTEPIRLFGFDRYPGIQSHTLYFRDDAVFYTRDRTDISISLIHSRSRKISLMLPAWFSDSEAVTWEYRHGGQWCAVERVVETESGVHLCFDSGNEPLQLEDGPACLLRCRLHKIPSGGLFITDISYTARGKELKADTLATGDAELTMERFSPFGEQLIIFSNFYISCREAFVKKGSVIDIDFEMEYYKAPIQAVVQTVEIDYRLIMTEEDFASIRERDVQIERVIWEYWNGFGWARLFGTGENEDFFTPAKGGLSKKRLTFSCPHDMETVVMGAAEGYFIRARLDKLSNMMFTTGNYIAPFVRHLEIGYHYDKSPVVCFQVQVESNVERQSFQFPTEGSVPLVTASLCTNPAMYLCLSGPLVGGPIRLLWDIEDGLHPNPPSLRWEYYGLTGQGQCGWKNIEVMDTTANLSRSAIVTLVGKKDFVRARFFGAEGYFIRIVNPDGRYDREDSRKSPVIRGIWFNTVPVVQREDRLPEFFYIKQGEENKRCQFSVKNVCEARVWVNELGALSVKEEEIFQSGREDVTIQRDATGKITALWIEWHEVENVETAGAEERAFSVDYAGSGIRFGNGRHGRIPTERDDESIMVRYVVCDGVYGNMPPHSILGFAATPPGASWVTNRKSLSGGADMETVDQASARSTGELLGMNRVVTLEDFQKAVIASNRNIWKVKCVPHTDRYSQPAVGTLAVAVLPREYNQGFENFTGIAKNALDKIREKASLLLTGSSHIDVFEVRYVEICVSAEVVISDYNLYHEVYQAISCRLGEFLNPISGNFNGQGWNIGQLPGRELIYNSIKTIKNIKWIKSLHMFTYVVTENGRQAVEFTQVKRDGFTVPIFGEPEINLTVE